MADYFSISRIFFSGGPTMVLLVIAFLIVSIIIIERMLYYKRVTPDSETLSGILDQVARRDVQQARAMLARVEGPVSALLLECLDTTQERPGQTQWNEDDYEEAKGRSISTSIPFLERYLNILATLGNISPFIGLLGTVMGIIRAFMSISDAASGGMAGLNAGIAEALVTTAAGLSVAIPSVVAHNFFRGKADAMLLQMEVLASRMKMRLKRSMETA